LRSIHLEKIYKIYKIGLDQGNQHQISSAFFKLLLINSKLLIFLTSPNQSPCVFYSL